GLLVQKQHRYIGTCTGEDIRWHTHHTTQPVTLNQSLSYFFLNSRLCGDKTRRHYNGCFTLITQTVHDVLDKKQINRHRLFFSLRNIRYACKEAFFESIFLQIVPKIREV